MLPALFALNIPAVSNRRSLFSRPAIASTFGGALVTLNPYDLFCTGVRMTNQMILGRPQFH